MKIHYYTRLMCTLLSGVQMVVLGQSITITPYFHQRARIIFPTIHRSRLVHVGKSSFTIENDVFEKELGEVLLRIKRSFAMMNISNGRSATIPENIRWEIWCYYLFICLFVTKNWDLCKALFSFASTLWPVHGIYCDGIICILSDAIPTLIHSFIAHVYCLVKAWFLYTAELA